MDMYSETEMAIQKTVLEFLKKKPLASIKVTEVAEAAHIHRTTFYLYYNSIYDVVQQIEDNLLSGFDRTRAAHNYVDLLEMMQAEREALLVLLGDNGEAYYKSRSLTQIRNYLQSALRSSTLGSANEDIIDLCCEFIANGKLSMALYWLSRKTALDTREMSELVVCLEEACYAAVYSFLNGRRECPGDKDT